MKYCPRCGCQLNDDDNYCPKCGNKVEKEIKEEKKEDIFDTSIQNKTDTPSIKENSNTITKDKNPVRIFKVFFIIAIMAIISTIVVFIIASTANNNENNNANKDYNPFTKAKPNISLSSEDMGLSAVFLLHCNDNYDKVVVDYKLYSNSTVILSSSLTFTTCLKGYDYTRKVDISYYAIHYDNLKMKYYISSYN